MRYEHLMVECGIQTRDTMPIRSYRDLDVWNNGLELITMTYRLTSSFPREELFGLTSQMRRASVSIVANVAEGWGTGYRNEYRRFVSTARGSQCELDALLTISKRLGFARGQDIQRMEMEIDRLGRMLWSLRQRLATR